jgi:hypothetical protein
MNRLLGEFGHTKPRESNGPTSSPVALGPAFGSVGSIPVEWDDLIIPDAKKEIEFATEVWALPRWDEPI